MKRAATQYNETNVDVHLFLILNMEKPKILNGVFLGDNKNSFTNVNTSRERKIRICVFLRALKGNSNHGIRLKTRMSLYGPLHSYVMLKLI